MDMGLVEQGTSLAVVTGEGLRKLGWYDLCARLCSGQDFRRNELTQWRQSVESARPAAWGGSFHGGAAKVLRHMGHAESHINPRSSMNGKSAEGRAAASSPPREHLAMPRPADEINHD